MAGRAQSRSRFLFGIEFTIQTYRVGRPRTITRLIVPRPSTADEEDTVHFAELTGVHPMIETYPLEKRPKVTRA